MISHDSKRDALLAAMQRQWVLCTTGNNGLLTGSIRAIITPADITGVARFRSAFLPRYRQHFRNLS